jgi:drug/metabolite transporter (DMT)-like permease
MSSEKAIHLLNARPMPPWLAPESCLRRLFDRRWFVLLMWQIASFALCIVNLFNDRLAVKNGNTLPFLQLSIAYAFVLVSNGFRYEKSDLPWLKYLICSAFTWGGDVAVVYAFNTTSFTSALLLSTTVIIWVAPVSYVLLKRKISILQLVGILIGFGGIVVIFIADEKGSSQWQGNVLATAAGVCYAFANVLQEDLVYKGGVTVFLTRFSVVSVPLNIVLGGAIEWKAIGEYDWDGITFVYVFAYAILLAIWYAGSSFVMQFSNAVEMNVSILTSNFYSLAISILGFGQKANWLYLVGFFCIPAAIIVYALFPPSTDPDEYSEDEIMGPMVSEPNAETGDSMPVPNAA